jgi:hypothetical protein
VWQNQKGVGVVLQGLYRNYRYDPSKLGQLRFSDYGIAQQAAIIDGFYNIRRIDPNSPKLNSYRAVIPFLSKMKIITKLCITAVLAAGLGFLGGCLSCPTARSTYCLLSSSSQVASNRMRDGIDGLVASIAETNQIQLFDSRTNKIGNLEARTYISPISGKDPTVYMEITYTQLPFRIVISESFVSRPSTRHRKLAQDIKTRFQEAGWQVIKAN